MFRSLLIGPMIIIFALCLSLNTQAQTLHNIPVANEFAVEGNLKSHLEDESLLVLGFYHCKHICQFVVKNLSRKLSTFSKYPKVIFLSIDETEGPRDALSLKKRIIGPEKHRWAFLTSDKESIEKLAKDLNFSMKRDPVSKQITHEIGFYSIKNGVVMNKISHLDITEKDLAFESRPESFISDIKKFCSEFDPSKSKYGHLVMKGLTIACVFFMFVAIGWFIYLRRKHP